jgi:hypothetical protein
MPATKGNWVAMMNALIDGVEASVLHSAAMCLLASFWL